MHKIAVMIDVNERSSDLRQKQWGNENFQK